MTLPEEIYNSILNHPEEWKLNNDYTFLIYKNKVCLYINQGWSMLQISIPIEITLPLRWRWKIWKAIQKTNLSKKLKKKTWKNTILQELTEL